MIAIWNLSFYFFFASSSRLFRQKIYQRIHTSVYPPFSPVKPTGEVQWATNMTSMYELCQIAKTTIVSSLF